jgi:hypothetical protein
MRSGLSLLRVTENMIPPRNRFYRWVRQAGVALVCVISMGVIASPAFGNLTRGLSPAIVPVAEPGEAPRAETIIVLDDAPNIEVSTAAAATVGNFLKGHAVLATLPRDGSRRYDNSSFAFFADREIRAPAVEIDLHIYPPRNIFSGQMSGVSDADMTEHSVTVSDDVNTERLNGDVGALKDFGKFDLASRKGSENYCENGDKESCDGKNFIMILGNVIPDIDKPIRSHEEKVRHAIALLIIFGIFCLIIF